MLSVLSPAKTLDFDTAPTTRKSTQPLFLEEATTLVGAARKMTPEDIQSLMGVSEKIAQLNHERFMNWAPDFSLDNAKQAVLAFKGDVYTGLRADALNPKELAFAQKHLRILSGLYGLLRPLDLMQPYRLEMGLPFHHAGGKNLYEFWGDSITQLLSKHVKASGSPVLVNLASNEYFKSVRPKLLDVEIVTPQFRDFKNVYQRLFREDYRLNENCACNYYVFSVQLTAAKTCLAHQTHHDLRAFFVPLFINKRLMAPTLTSRTAASPFPSGAGSHCSAKS